MNKRNAIIIILVIAELFLIGGAYVLGTKLRKAPVAEKPAAVSEIVKGTAIVDITDQGFSPATLKAKKGTLVTFVNKGDNQHRVASDPYPTHGKLPGFDSPVLAKGETYFFLFDKTGTFTYHDHLDPTKFTGTVIVD